MSEEVVQAALIVVARNASNAPYFTLENGHTKQRSQTGNPYYGHNKSLSTVYSPLDALSIPKAISECKTIHNLFANLLRCLVIRHIVPQNCNVYQISIAKFLFQAWRTSAFCLCMSDVVLL